jgi:hypothetical protein
MRTLREGELTVIYALCAGLGFADTNSGYIDALVGKWFRTHYGGGKRDRAQRNLFAQQHKNACSLLELYALFA